jgi:uncharacterized protein
LNAVGLADHRLLGCIDAAAAYREEAKPAAGRGQSIFYGIVAGFASTIANAAAPVMNMYLLSRKLPEEQFVATGAWFFLVINLARVPIYSWHHLFSHTSLRFALLMAPAVICGTLAGLWIVHRVPQRVFDVMIVLLTGISAFVLLR